MAFFLTLFMAGFFFINYLISNFEIFAPNVVFCMTFFVYSLGCLYGDIVYGNNIHYQCAMVMVFGALIFTLVAIICRMLQPKKIIKKMHIIQPIVINSVYYFVFIIIELICIYYQYRY